MQIWLNGALVSKEQAVVSVYDHGFLYGDGVFEGIRVYDGTIFRLAPHLERLYESAKTIRLEIPQSYDELERAVVETVAASGLRDAYIRLVVSRGTGDLGIDPDKCPKPTVAIIVDSIKLYAQSVYDEGLSLVTASTRRVPMSSFDPRIKSLNYLNNIMAKLEAKQSGAPEAVMLNEHGRVAECTADNIFIVKGRRLLTPDLMEGALGGITRATVIEIAPAAGLEPIETKLGLHDLYNADECFLTGTGAEVVPVVALDGRRIGSGRPGDVTRDLLARYRELRVRDGVRVEYGSAATTS